MWFSLNVCVSRSGGFLVSQFFSEPALDVDVVSRLSEGIANGECRWRAEALKATTAIPEFEE
jgi:hypothetical protein